MLPAVAMSGKGKRTLVGTNCGKVFAKRFSLLLRHAAMTQQQQSRHTQPGHGDCKAPERIGVGRCEGFAVGYRETAVDEV